MQLDSNIQRISVQGVTFTQHSDCNTTLGGELWQHSYKATIIQQKNDGILRIFAPTTKLYKV